MSHAVVVGCKGQDGYYLTQHLEALGYAVTGIARDAVVFDDGATGPAIDIRNRAAVRTLLAETGPDEIYHLAAHHHSSEEHPGDDGALFIESFAVHTDSLLAFLEGMRVEVPTARLFYGASALVFGEPDSSPQNEDTRMAPICAYGISKTAGVHLCRYYRANHGLFCTAGFLFSHESPRRPSRFVSRRIVQTALQIARGEATTLELGDPDAVIDWGYAADYVDAMHRMLQLDTPQDFVIATGRATRLREFVTHVFERLGLDPETSLQTDPGRMVRRRQTPLIGDSSRLTAATGWRPVHDIADLARIMVDAERKA